MLCFKLLMVFFLNQQEEQMSALANGAEILGDEVNEGVICYELEN